MASDRVLRSELGRAFPGCGWLSEESRGAAKALDRHWLVDPLDGTRELVARRAGFMVSVALVADGHPVVGVIVCPLTGRLWSAEAGEGASLDGLPIRVIATDRLESSRMLVSRTEMSRGQLEAFDAQLPLCPAGGMANKLASIADGSADGTFTLRRRHTWDVAAGWVILREAGGALTRVDGTELDWDPASPAFEGMVASNGILHAELLRTVGAAASP